jgi:hypothetical protein
LLTAAGLAITAAAAMAASGWFLQSTPTAPGTRLSYLYGVSCVSADRCTAAGVLDTGGPAFGRGLAERWNGSGWKIQPMPNPAGSGDTLLYNISCTSADACTTVGSYRDANHDRQALAERWNGTSWKIQPVVNPGVGQFTGNELLGISCFAAQACIAIGDYQAPSGKYVTLAERWNGTSWKVQPTPNPAGATDVLLIGGVSCFAADACTAVGNWNKSDKEFRPLVLRWNGASWKLQAPAKPAVGKNVFISGVSCFGPKACVAVGGYTAAGNTKFFVQRWDGSSWKIQPAPIPAGAKPNYLNSVSCLSANACTAVGDYTNAAGRRVTLAEHWDGASWKIQPTGNTSGQAENLLRGVSCSGATACSAVGYRTSPKGLRTLAELHH